MPAAGRACRVVVPPSQSSAGSAVAVAVRLEPSRLTVTCVVLEQPPCGLVTVRVNVWLCWRATVWVVCELGLVTIFAGSQWKLKVPDAPALPVKLELPP